MASALALYHLGPGWGALALGFGAALALAAVLALAIGLFSLRVQAIFFAMVTLAVAYAFNVLASQLPDITGGEDGRSFRVPEFLRPGHKFGEFLGHADHRAHAQLLSGVRRLRRRCFWFCCASSTRRSGGCCRRSAKTRSAPRRWATASCFIARWRRIVAAWRRPARARSTRCGCAMSDPDTALSFSIQIDVLVIVVIGGRGTLYGAVVGRGGVRDRGELSAAR